MAIKNLTRQLLIDSLEKLAIRPGDNLLVHSAIQFLGFPIGGPKMICDTLIDVISLNGTLVVPTFNFDFAKGKEYHPKTTPSINMGVFSEYVRQLPQAHRSSHPMQSVAAIGKYAMDLSLCDTPGAFDVGSVFERMLQLDFKCLLLGASINACSIIHFSEQKAEVPYRYWKDFNGRIDGKDRTYRMLVRNLDLNPQLDLSLIQKELMEKGLWSSVKINYGELSLFSLRNFQQVADSLLSKDPYALLLNRKFVMESLANFSK